MSFDFNAYSLVLLFFGVTNIILAVHIYKRANSTIRWFALVMLFSSLWSVAYSFELASLTLDQAYFFVILEYLGISFLPFFWLIFALEFNNKNSWYRKKKNFLFLLFWPVTNFIIVLTNQKHFWYFSKVILVKEPNSFPMLTYEYGYIYSIFSIYAYFMILLGYYHFILRLKQSDNNFRVQYTIITIFALVPWFGDILYKIGLRINGHIEITPYLFIVTSIFVFIGIYHYKLFDIVPIARAKILDIIDDGFVLIDQNFKIIDHNQSLKRFLRPQEMRSFIGMDAKEIFKEYPELNLEEINTDEQKKVLLQANFGEETQYFQATSILLNDNNININSTIIKFQDLTTKQIENLKAKEQAKELEELNQLKDQVFSTIAIDLRGPIINISEIFKLISEKQIDKEEFKALAPILSKEVIQTTEMLENLLHWSRSQLKGFGIKKENFNIRDIINNEINYYQPVAAIKKITIHNNISKEDIAYGDIILFQIVTRNILNNAIKFTNNNGQIDIHSIKKEKHKICICFSDNGVGISKDKLGKLLRYNLKDFNKNTRKRTETGLGLIICQEFMQKNGGYITIESELGKGSKFYLWIPMNDNSIENQLSQDS